jgi:hypothetical protein
MEMDGAIGVPGFPPEVLVFPQALSSALIPQRIAVATISLARTFK